MPTVSQAIEAFIRSKLPRYSDPGIANRWLERGCAFETQVNIDESKGELARSPKSKPYWVDGTTELWHIRIPKNAKSDPHFRDYELRWSLTDYALKIGSTGWCWTERKSYFVGFDFDTIAHADGLDAEKLDQIKQKVLNLDYCEVRRSTGGEGLHIYVELPGIATANHTEHAALAESVLRQMSRDASFDFTENVDTCGGNFWFWSRRMNDRSYQLIKEATCSQEKN